VVENDLPPTPKIGKLLAASYDEHTREGQSAIMKFFRETPQLHKFVEACPPDKQRELKMNAVFRAEGGLLRTQLFYGLSPITSDTVASEKRYVSMLPPELAKDFLPTVRSLLPQLNEAREKVLWAVIKSKSVA